MSKLGEAALRNAREQIGVPFRHHFKPENLCEYGNNTVDVCMQRGMDSLQGYDCSGLAIVSICRTLDISPKQWPRDLRHTQQLASLAIDAVPQPGDLRLFYSDKNRIHIGVATESDAVIHASGLTKVVEESIVEDPSGSFTDVRMIALDSLVGLVRQKLG